MNYSKIFRLTLIASIILVVLGVIAEFTTEGWLPKELQDYLASELESDFSISDIVAVLCVLPLISLIIVSYVGLFLWKPWGRTCFLISGILSYLIAPFIGPYVYSGIALTLYDLASVTFGLILGLAYFSPLKEKFRKSNKTAHANPLPAE